MARITRDDKPNAISFGGKTYNSNADGVFDIPDSEFSRTLYGLGFYDAPPAEEKPKSKAKPKPVEYAKTAEDMPTNGNLD